jgi:hypothetical protein
MSTTVTAVNYTQSLAAIRNFVRAAVSFITYARGLCSDNAYEQRPFLGLPLRQLIPSTKESIALSEWIEKGAFDALNRNYLKEMSLCVYDEACTQLLESYCFGFNYSADGQRAQMSLSASQNAQKGDGITTEITPAARTVPAYRRRRCTKQEVQRMLTHILKRLLEVVGSLPPLLSKRVLTMRLTYYDSVTPASYEPPCFAPASLHLHQLYQEEVKLHVHIGSVDTSHHLFSVAIRHPLLQLVQSQVSSSLAASSSSFTTAAAATGLLKDHTDEEAADYSGPLRSGLESTFSSVPMVHGDAACAVERGCTCRPDVLAATAVTPRSGLSEKATGVGSDRCSDAGGRCVEEVEGASVGAEHEQLDTACTNTAVGDQKAVPPAVTVQCLVDEATTTAAVRSRALRSHELTYLLLASFAFAHAASVRGGRGRLSWGEVDSYRTQSCPLDMTETTAYQMVLRLTREGYLVPCGESKKAVTQRTPEPQRNPFSSTGVSAVLEWTVPDPPLPLLLRLLQVTALTQLLTHPCHVALQELCVYLEREKTRGAVCSASERDTPAVKRRKRVRG